MAFRYRSRRPVLAYARTEHDDCLIFNSLFNCLTELTGEGRFLPIVLLANSIHPGLPLIPPSGRHRVGLGELASLKREGGKVISVCRINLF